MFNFNAVAAASGYVHVQSDRPLSGLELWGNATVLAALRPAPASTETRLFFPHFAVNGGYTSLIGVVNTSNLNLNLTLTGYANDGTLLGTPAVRAVSANGQLLESAASLLGLSPGALVTGYIVAESDTPGITGFSAFTYDNGSVHASAAVPSESIPQPTLYFSHVANGVPAGSGGNYVTGIALLNPFGTPVTYTLKVFDGTGSMLAQMTDVLGPHVKVAKLLSSPLPGAAFFTQPISLGNGHIEVTADYQVLGFEMFFTETQSQIVAVMAQYPR